MGPWLGFAAFAGVKYLGYSAAAWRLNTVYSNSRRSAWLVGAARTGIGLVIGIAYGTLWMFRAPAVNPVAIFFLLLLPIRMIEWGVLLRWFYEPGFLLARRAWMAAGLGTVWSYLLDAVAVAAALVTPGGRWLC